MDTRTKVSPAFAPFFAASGPGDKHEAIVIYSGARARDVVDMPLHGRLRELQKRLDYVEERAAAQRPVRDRVLMGYQEAARKIRRAPDVELASLRSSVLPVLSCQVTKRTLLMLAEQEDVIAILPNQPVHLIRPTTVGYDDLARQESKDGLTWGLKQLGIPEVWKHTKGKDISIGVLDTGVQADHPALRGKVKDFVIVDPRGRRSVAQPPIDGDEHGTHVCGTIAGGRTAKGVAIGVAPEADLYVAAVLLGSPQVSTVIEGIMWAMEKGADIISMSLGLSYYEPKFDIILRMLVDQYDILPVAAIGNESHGNTSSPGSAPSALAVGAVERVQGGGLSVASFSSGASLVFPGDEPNALVTKPDVVAPGVQVYSCVPPAGYAYMDGTSMATPHVSGIAALLMAAAPTAPASQIQDVLRQTARHPQGNSRRPDNRWGYGLVDAVAAYRALTGA